MDRFHTAFNGYNKKEVNQFVSDVVVRVENMINREKLKDEKIKTLTEQVARYKNMENTLNRVVIVAEEAGHQIKKNAQNESEMILEEARKNANRIVNDALVKAEEAQREAETLKRNIAACKRKIKDALENQIRELDKFDESYYKNM